MKETAGTLLYRYSDDELEVLLVHPSGNYNKRSPWSIPKGLPDPAEPLEIAARRETLEETGIAAQSLYPLGFIDYTKSRKRVYCFAGEAPEHASPHPASWEIDKAEFVSIGEARKRIHPDQAAFLARLEHFLEKFKRKKL